MTDVHRYGRWPFVWTRYLSATEEKDCSHEQKYGVSSVMRISMIVVEVVELAGDESQVMS